MLPQLAVIFITTAVLTFVLRYLGYYLTHIMPVMLGLLLVLIGLLNHFFKTNNKTLSLKLSITFITALLLEVLVVLSGGILSAYIFLIYLFTIATGLFINFKAAVIFLASFIILLISTIIVDPLIQKIVSDDPWVFITFAITSVVIVALTIYLIQTYNLKSLLSSSLTNKLSLADQRERSIIKAINEIIIITDKNLKIVSLSSTAEEIVLYPPQELLNKSLLEVIQLNQEDGTKATEGTLQIPNILQDKTTKTIKNLFLYYPKQNQKNKVIIESQGIVDTDQQIYQFVFIIKQEKDVLDDMLIAPGVTDAQLHFNLLVDQIKNNLPNELFSIKSQLNLLAHTEEDILIAQELRQLSKKPTKVQVNLTEFCKKLILSKQPFAISLKTHLDFENHLGGETEPLGEIDSRPFSIMLSKIIELALLLTRGTIEQTVKVILNPEQKNYSIKIVFTPQTLTPNWKKDIFTTFYGQLGKNTDLKMGSGLEGYIFDYLVHQQNIDCKIKQENDKVEITILIKKS